MNKQINKNEKNISLESLVNAIFYSFIPGPEKKELIDKKLETARKIAERKEQSINNQDKIKELITKYTYAVSSAIIDCDKILQNRNFAYYRFNIMLLFLAIDMDAAYKNNIRNCKELYFVDIMGEPKLLQRNSCSKEYWNRMLNNFGAFRTKEEVVAAKILLRDEIKKIKVQDREWNKQSEF